MDIGYMQRKAATLLNFGVGRLVVTCSLDGSTLSLRSAQGHAAMAVDGSEQDIDLPGERAPARATVRLDGDVIEVSCPARQVMMPEVARRQQDSGGHRMQGTHDHASLHETTREHRLVRSIGWTLTRGRRTAGRRGVDRRRQATAPDFARATLPSVDSWRPLRSLATLAFRCATPTPRPHSAHGALRAARRMRPSEEGSVKGVTPAQLCRMPWHEDSARRRQRPLILLAIQSHVVRSNVKAGPQHTVAIQGVAFRA